MVALGIDIGGTWLRTLHGSDETSRTFGSPMPVPKTLDAFIDTVTTVIHSVPETVSVAIGLPGRTGLSQVQWVPALPFLDGVDLAPVLQERTKAHVVLMNDAQLSLLAEVKEGAALGRAHVVLVAIGTGIGGAVMIDGKLVSGATGTLGSFGWMSVPNAGEPDPQHGAWERSASGSSFAARAGGHDAAVELMKNARETGVVDGLVEEYGRQLGFGLSALASVFDPEVILIAGGISEDISTLEPTLRASMQANASPTGRMVPIRPGALGSKAGVIGAFHKALEGMRR